MTEVSIIIPAYNRVELLEQTIQSCLAQTFTDCEVLVVDDGSEIPLEPAIEKINRTNNSSISIQYFRQERAGANTARNQGIQKATGKYIQFLDSDDLLHPRKIEIQKEILDLDSDVDMCYCLNQHFREHPGDMKILWNLSDQPFHLERLLWFDHVWQTGSPLWRKSVFENIELWNEDLICLQEWEFHLKALAKKIRYAHVPYVLQYLREHDRPRSASLSPLLEYQESVRTAIRSAYQFLEKCGLLTSDRADALAGTLLASSDDLIRNGFKQEGLASLDLANQYAKGSCFKHLGRWMQIGSQNRILWMTIGRYARIILTGIVRERAGLFMKSKVRSEHLISDKTIVANRNFLNENAKPIVSVVVPVLEPSDRLKLLLQDLFEQTVNHDDFEIVIVSRSKIEIETKGNIQFIHQQLRSGHHAKYVGAQAARGQILVFLDLDSKVNKYWLSNYINAFSAHPQISAASGPINLDWDQTPEEWTLNLIRDHPAFNFENRTKLCISPDSSLLNKNLAITRNAFLQMKIPELVAVDYTTINYPEILLLQRFHNGKLLFAYLPEAAIVQSIPTYNMTLKFLEDRARKWGLLSEYGKNLERKNSRFELFFELLKKFGSYLVFYILMKPKTSSEYVRWRIDKASNFQQMRLIFRLIFDSDLRRDLE